MNISKDDLAKYIDNTLLKQDATEADIVALCRQSVQYAFKAVCVNSCWVKLAARETAGSGVEVCSVIGFPLGAGISASKACEAELAIADGAMEIDMVINVGALKSGLLDYVKEDVAAVVAACKGKAILKVILEMCLLTEEEKRKAIELSRDAGADFVKTSTGFSTGGATVEDVALMHSIVGGKMGIKAAGGIRSLDDARRVIEAGATRIGTSNGAKIIDGVEVTSGY
ncbi:MAG: deoxyribose-phosphate aldolase [Planctomycetes bacterium]|nr:deoxyribose-phosphate aldolase [Planctomycetota bacterium]MCD7896588.1 deoxyribose-phosphate aldolase [Planctomycetaceae bacterium]